VRVEIELAKCGTTPEYLVRDAEDVPELQQRMSLLRSPEAKLRVALEWFGDEGHPQPETRTRPFLYALWDVEAYGDVTPSWGRLQRLEDGEPTDAQPEPTAQQPKNKKPRHRRPDLLEKRKVKKLMWELAQRKARPPRDPEFTQEKIAQRLGWDRSRVQQAEGLQKRGWDLLRSDSEFSADDDFVRWPSVKEAARLMASERAEN